jgi:hypothetical protein
MVRRANFQGVAMLRKLLTILSALVAAAIVMGLLAGWFLLREVAKTQNDVFGPLTFVRSGIAKIKIGEQKFAVPAEYLDGPLQITGHDGDYSVVRAILFNGLAPDFQPKTAANEVAFQKAPCCIRALITPTTIVHGKDIIPKLTKNGLFWNLDIVSQTQEADNIHYVVRAHKGMGPFPSEYGDIYVRADGQQVTRCNRIDTSNGRHSVVVLCQVDNAGQSECYQITVPGNNATQRKAELARVWNAMNSWMR